MQVGERYDDRLQGTEQLYKIKRIIGNGSFGVVYRAITCEGETVAIKKVLQDNRFKVKICCNRYLFLLSHNVQKQ